MRQHTLARPAAEQKGSILMSIDQFEGENRIDQGQGGNLMVHGWPLEQCVVSAHDREILRGLGRRLKELAERPYEQ